MAAQVLRSASEWQTRQLGPCSTPPAPKASLDCAVLTDWRLVGSQLFVDHVWFWEPGLAVRTLDDLIPAYHDVVGNGLTMELDFAIVTIAILSRFACCPSR